MRILSVHIENFGNFNKKQFDFKEGYNVTVAENGWGKSTLSAFIKAMLYGLDERGRKQSGTFERERYLPWQGGKFGGSLTFTHNGETYKITRFFDEKKRERDSCVVTDMRTNQATGIFGDDIGLHLFGIGKESFERSCFINSDDSKKPELNDDISAKLNKILETGGDIGDCQSAVDAIDSLVTNLGGKGKNSRAVFLRNEIQSLKNRIALIDAVEKAVPQQERLLEDEKAAFTQIDSELHLLEDKKNNVLLYEQKKIYTGLLDRSAREKTALDGLYDFFNGTVPESSSLENIKAANSEYMQARTELSHNNVTDADRKRFSELQAFFGQDVPSSDDIEQCQKLINERNRIWQEIASNRLTENEKVKLQAYGKQFAGIAVSDAIIRRELDYVSNVQHMENDKAVLLEKQKALRAASEADEKNAKKRRLSCLVFGAAALLVFAALGAGIFVFTHNIVFSIPAFALAVVSVVSEFAVKPAKSRDAASDLSRVTQDISSLSDSIRERKEAYTSFIKSVHPSSLAENPAFELSAIQSEYDSYTELLQKAETYRASLHENGELDEIERRIKSFIAPYESKCNTTDADTILPILRKNRAEYEAASKAILRYDAARSALQENQEKLVKWLGRYKIDVTVSFEKQLDDVREKLLRFNNTRSAIADVTKEIAAFEKTHDIDLLAKALPSDKTSSEIQATIDSAQDRLQNIKSNINSYREKLDIDYNEIDTKRDYERELEMNRNELSKLDARLRILEKTRDLLEQARDSLSGRYMKKMEKAFSAYLAELQSGEHISIDKDLNVYVEGAGSTYGSEYLSEGYKDIVNFCIRMALVDAMFETEQPVLILDDPFVNLDKDKIANALRVVGLAARDKQVIYFTCHESRGHLN